MGSPKPAKMAGLQLIVFKTEVPEALGDGVKARRLRLIPERVVGIGSIDNLG
jgi:hypothetical protein